MPQRLGQKRATKGSKPEASKPRNTKMEKTNKEQGLHQQLRKHLKTKKTLERSQALDRIERLLNAKHHQPNQLKEVLALIQLFNIQADELTELNISYEWVKALERHHALWF